MSRLAAALVLVLALTGCSFFGSDDPDLDQVPIGGDNNLKDVPRALRPFYRQELAWRECRSEALCADLEVPLDYDRPRGRTITLSLLKVPAQQRAIGSLVVNPGGPGGSGIEYAVGGSSYWGNALRDFFDIVGFDPRGVGESTPVDCASDEELDAFLAADPSPDNAAEWQESDRLAKEFFEGCMSRNAALATHMSTEEAARDIDILRSALNQAKLSFFGASYGTFLGGTYADLFPQRVGRMVLDGAVDPSIPTVEASRIQAEGFETALRAYVGHCVDAGECYLGGSVDEGTARIREFLEELDAQPINGSGGRDLTEGLAVFGLIAPLYNRDYWGILDNALAAGLRGAGAQLVALSDAYTRRGPFGYTDNAIEVLNVVNCLDHDDPVPESEIPSLVPAFEEASPTLGRIFASGLSICADWSFRSGKEGASLVAEGSPAIVVIGTTRDPATPLRWAEALVDQLENAVLIRRDGDGHTGYKSGNRCVDDLVERYLVSGEVPREVTDC